MSTELWQRDAEAAAPDPTTDPVGEAPRRPRWRRRWVWVAVLAAAVVAVAVLFVSQGPGPASSAPLDPRNPTANGAQALARVLEAQGVQVDIARGQAELERAGADGDNRGGEDRHEHPAPPPAGGSRRAAVGRGAAR